MRVRLFLVTAITVLFVTSAPAHADVWAGDSYSTVALPVSAPPTTIDEPSRPPVTFNEFLPEERGLGECISSAPRPGCGSEARGGWHQTLVFIAIMLGLCVIVWRIVAGARAARKGSDPLRTPSPTTIGPPNRPEGT
ncbi:MAG: hypothetical protein ABIP17_05275 [Ilumatobacteraceae bacterium]